MRPPMLVHTGQKQYRIVFPKAMSSRTNAAFVSRRSLTTPLICVPKSKPRYVQVEPENRLRSSRPKTSTPSSSRRMTAAVRGLQQHSSTSGDDHAYDGRMSAPRIKLFPTLYSMVLASK